MYYAKVFILIEKCLGIITTTVLKINFQNITWTKKGC